MSLPQADQWAALRGRSLLIAVPAYTGAVHVRHVASLIESLALLSAAGVATKCHWLTDCAIIVRARNEIVASFMATGLDYLLMADSDIAWDADAPLRLMRHDLPFVAATTVTRGTKQFCVRNATWGDRAFDYDPVAGLLRVGAVGTGYVMLRRDMIERMAAGYLDLKLEDERVPPDQRQHLYAYFHQMITPARTLEGEDYALCERWRALGGDVFVDPHIGLTHFGREEMSGRLIDVMQFPAAEAA